MAYAFHSWIFDRNMMKVKIKENQKKTIINGIKFHLSYHFTYSSSARIIKMCEQWFILYL